jgi:hypothetical protein
MGHDYKAALEYFNLDACDCKLCGEEVTAIRHALKIADVFSQSSDSDIQAMLKEIEDAK